MFWKKKETIELELDSRHNDNRASCRIAPDGERPVIISIDGEDFKALNISGSGLVFRSNRFEVGKRCTAMVRLPSETSVFPLVLEVVAKQEELCRCCFRDILEDTENLLHAYILELQKLKIWQNHGQG